MNESRESKDQTSGHMGSSGWWSRPHHANNMVTAIATVLVAGFTLLSGYVGAQIGADTALRVAAVQTESENAKRAQEKREQVYGSYLNAARAYSSETHNLNSVFNKSIQNIGNGTIEMVESVPALLDAQRRYEKARSAYQDSINQVYVFGSDAAWEAHERMAALLPPSLRSVPLKYPPPSPPESEAFIRAYQDFQSVVCAEVAPVVRASCRRDVAT